jgi:hypothetical protein
LVREDDVGGRFRRDRDRRFEDLVEGESYRLAYNGAYDTLRHAAEVVVQGAGGRVTSGLGGHEAVFALADALVGDDAPGVFAGQRATSLLPPCDSQFHKLNAAMTDS